MSVGRFAGRADRAEAGRAGGDLELDLLPESVVVDLAAGNGVTMATDRPANASPFVLIRFSQASTHVIASIKMRSHWRKS